MAARGSNKVMRAGKTRKFTDTQGRESLVVLEA